MDAEKSYQRWVARENTRETEDERAICDFLNGEGWGLDQRTVRKFVRHCREVVGPDPILRPARNMVMNGVWYEWGVWFRPRGRKGAAVQAESAYGFSSVEAEEESVEAVADAEETAVAEKTSAPVPGVVPVASLAPGVPEPAEVVAAKAGTAPVKRSSVAAVSSSGHRSEPDPASEPATEEESTSQEYFTGR